MTDKEKKPLSPYDTYGTDNNLESGQGVDIAYPFGTFTIHRAGGTNKKFSTVFNAKLKPHIRKHDQGILEDEIKERILIETYAETVIIGWKDVHDRAGKKMSFNVKNCVKLLTDLPDLFTDIQLQAADFATFKGEQEEVIIKN